MLEKINLFLYMNEYWSLEIHERNLPLQVPDAPVHVTIASPTETLGRLQAISAELCVVLVDLTDIFPISVKVTHIHGKNNEGSFTHYFKPLSRYMNNNAIQITKAWGSGSIFPKLQYIW